MIYILYRCGQDDIYILYRCGQDEPEERKDEEEDEKERRKKEQERSKAQIAEQLLQLGAKTGAKELKGEQTPLHLAAMNGMEQVQCICFFCVCLYPINVNRTSPNFVWDITWPHGRFMNDQKFRNSPPTKIDFI